MHHHNPSRWRTLPATLATALLAAAIALAAGQLPLIGQAPPPTAAELEAAAIDLAQAEREQRETVNVMNRRLADWPNAWPAECPRTASWPTPGATAAADILADYPSDHAEALAVALAADRETARNVDRAARPACKSATWLAQVLASLADRHAAAAQDEANARARLGDAQTLAERVTTAQADADEAKALAADAKAEADRAHSRLTADEAELARIAAELGTKIDLLGAEQAEPPECPEDPALCTDTDREAAYEALNAVHYTPHWISTSDRYPCGPWQGTLGELVTALGRSPLDPWLEAQGITVGRNDRLPEAAWPAECADALHHYRTVWLALDESRTWPLH